MWTRVDTRREGGGSSYLIVYNLHGFIVGKTACLVKGISKSYGNERGKRRKSFSYYTLTLLPNTFCCAEFSIIFPFALVFLYCNLFPTLISRERQKIGNQKDPAAPLCHFLLRRDAGGRPARLPETILTEICPGRLRRMAKIWLLFAIFPLFETTVPACSFYTSIRVLETIVTLQENLRTNHSYG